MLVGKFAAGAIVKLVAKARDTEEPAIKRWKGTVGGIFSVPILCAKLIVAIAESIEGGESKVLNVNKYLEAWYQFSGTWGRVVAAWNDEVENELLYAGLAVHQLSWFASFLLLEVDLHYYAKQ